jgi:hypothetical protein
LPLLLLSRVLPALAVFVKPRMRIDLSLSLSHAHARFLIPNTHLRARENSLQTAPREQLFSPSLSLSIAKRRARAHQPTMALDLGSIPPAPSLRE